MRTALASLLLLLAIACGDDPPPTQAAVQPAPVPPQTEPPLPVTQPAMVTEQRPSPDVALSARVKKALDEAVSDLSQGIDVTASNGVVRLFGTVTSSEARTKAQKIASSIPGVTSVDNKLVVLKGS